MLLVVNSTFKIRLQVLLTIGCNSAPLQSTDCIRIIGLSVQGVLMPNTLLAVPVSSGGLEGANVYRDN